MVLDSKLLVDVALELAELVLAGGCGGMTPARRDEHVGQVDGLGVGHDRRDGVARLKSAGQGVVTERVDQRDPPVAVEPVPCPKSSYVSCLGGRVCGCLAAVASGQPVAASLGVEDLGQVADVVLVAAAGADGWPEPDQVTGADIDLDGLPGDGEPEGAAAGGAAPADRAADVRGQDRVAPGAVPGRSSGSA